MKDKDRLIKSLTEEKVVLNSQVVENNKAISFLNSEIMKMKEENTNLKEDKTTRVYNSNLK